MKITTALATGVALCVLAASPATAFDGWHLESATIIDGKGSAWDYLSLDPTGAKLFIGHRKEGLQVYDTAARKLVGTVAGTPDASSNGATLMPEFDLAVSNNENGTLIPFKMSTLAPAEPLKLGEELDTSHYDPATKRIIVNMAAGKEGTDLIVLQAPGLEKAGVVTVKSKKPEHAAGDGKGMLFMATRDLETVMKIDMKALKVVAEWPTPGCGQTNSLAFDEANNRILLGCRGNEKTKPSFAVMDANDGKIVFSSEVGGGNDGLAYDAATKRVFLTNGVNAIMNVFEQADANTYKQIEALGTNAGVRSLAFDPKIQKIYAVTAEGTADFAKKITTTVSPWYANVFYPNTFKVLVYSK